MENKVEDKQALIEKISQAIIEGFDKHIRILNEYTSKAVVLFEKADWKQMQRISRERIQGYDIRVEEARAALDNLIGNRQELLDDNLWQEVKAIYAVMLKSHLRPKLTESFYDSVFCRIHHRRYYHNDNIFVRYSISFNDI